MVLVEADRSGTPLQTRFGDASAQYTASFLKAFLPAYQVVNQSQSISSVADRYEAIKFAADASLAVAARGTTWSDALSKKLGEVSPLEEEVLPTSRESGSESEASTSMGHQISEFDRTNFFYEPRVSAEKTSQRRKREGNPGEPRNGVVGKRNFALRLVSRAGRRSWNRSQVSCGDTYRSAVLRKLGMRSKSPSRQCRNFWKPRAVLRKVKSLSNPRRRSIQSARPVEPLEADLTHDSGISALQRLVPGGSEMDAVDLLDETADFVIFLKLQVQALLSVAQAVDSLQ